MFPDVSKTRVIFPSAAEESFYQQCKNSLKDHWRIYYSCNLSTLNKDEGVIDNEMDFVAYHPKYGVIVIEVKGGRIQYEKENGKFYSINRHDEKFEIKDPFRQALVWKSRFLRYLRNENLKVPVTHCVCFPSVRENEIPKMAGIEPELIIGRQRINDLENALSEIANKSHPENFLQFEDVSQQLDRILVGTTFTTKLFLRDYIDSHESRVKDIEALSETFLTPISSSERLGIEGEAGTGKTVLAWLLARKFNDLEQKVLLMTSNTLLKLFLQKQVGDGVNVVTYLEKAEELGVNLVVPDETYTGTKEDWIQFEAPVRLKQKILASSERYDVIICDESQDVQPFWWEAIESMLASKDSKLYLFFDRSQGVFGSGGKTGSFVPSQVLPVPETYFPLVHNYRNTREIAGFSREFRTGKTILQSHCGRLGYMPELITYKDVEDCQRVLARLVRKLNREEGIDTKEITLLSARDPTAKNSVLYKCEEIAKIPLHRLTHNNKKHWKEASAPRGAIGVSTIIGFKGLETPIGIVLNISEYNLPLENPIMSSLVYVAATRAKHMLYILMQENDVGIAKIKKAIESIDATGGLVIEGSMADFEFVGRISHYNPHRMGWLSVSDPAFQANKIMFFPYDVKLAGIDDIKVGQKLRFRPRAEGNHTIATDLKIVG